jgi:hypothetical protein
MQHALKFKMHGGMPFLIVLDEGTQSASHKATELHGALSTTSICRDQ